MPAAIDLKVLQSESRNTNSLDIDVVPTEELCQIINNEDATVAGSISPCLPIIAEAIDALTEVVRNGGKVVYVGAGTSGRLGVLDASELPPTFSADAEQFVALIAGGDRALRHAQEGAEDDSQQAVRDMHTVKLQSGDGLIGIAASGRTPYVISCLSYAKQLGCATVGVACSSPSAMRISGHVDHMIEAVTGAEVVTGSTRMKAGTATKMVLNMISTGIQIKLGKTFGNMMVDVKATNLKLQQRARNILREVCGSGCPNSDAELDEVLQQSGGSVKVAIAMISLGASADEARQRLDEVNGVLGILLQDADTRQQPRVNGAHSNEQSFVLCVDGGGSKCAAYVIGQNGEYGEAKGPACNVTTSSLIDAVKIIAKAASDAMAGCKSLRGRSLSDVTFAKVWIGLAGFDRPQIAAKVGPMLDGLFNGGTRSRLKVTNDLELLATAAGGTEGRDVCVLVAGTGSIAMVFRRNDSGYTKIRRAGGWGPLLGDDGSGFDIGRQAIRHTLDKLEDADRAAIDDDTLANAVLQHLQVEPHSKTVQEVLSSVLLSSENDSMDPRQRIADVARVVIQEQKSSSTADGIIIGSVEALAKLLQWAVRSTAIEPVSTALVMTGGLLNAPAYLEQLRDAITAAGLTFHGSDCVSEPGLLGAKYLSSVTR